MIFAYVFPANVVCPSCVRPLYSSGWSEDGKSATWRCQNPNCVNTGKEFRYMLPQVQLDEVPPGE